MRLSTLQLTTGPVPSFSALPTCHRHTSRNPILAEPQETERFWSPRNLLSQPGRHSTQNLPESVPGSVRGTARECHAATGHGEHCSTLCLSLLLKGPPKRDRIPQTGHMIPSCRWVRPSVESIRAYKPLSRVLPL